MSKLLFRNGEFNRAIGSSTLISVSSETPVLRSFGYEILDHSPNSVDLVRLSDGAPLLLQHDKDEQIGVIEKATVENRKLMCSFRFSKSDKAQEIEQDVKDEIRRNVSVGYMVEEMIFDSVAEDGIDVYRATRWVPYEVSIVSVPADQTVGFGREFEGEEVDISDILVNPEVEHE